MKKSLLALAVSLAAASGAHAAWDNGSVDGFGGNGELLLAVWDDNAAHQVSVSVDLGDRFFDYEPNLGNASFSKTYNLDASAFSVFSTSNAADLHYAVIAISNGAFNPVIQQVMVTTNASTPVVTASDIANVVNASPVTAGKINQTDIDYTTNKTIVSGAGTNYQWLGDNGVFGVNFTSQSLPFNMTGGIGEKLAFWEFNGTNETGVADIKAVGQWSINLTSNTLSFAAPTAPAVPVPGAAWLMGSALVGLGSIARRRRAV